MMVRLTLRLKLSKHSPPSILSENALGGRGSQRALGLLNEHFLRTSTIYLYLCTLWSLQRFVLVGFVIKKVTTGQEFKMQTLVQMKRGKYSKITGVKIECLMVVIK